MNDFERELNALKNSYRLELEGLGKRVADATAKLDRVSDHDAFNMSAACQTLAVLAGKIAQTENVIRWTAAADDLDEEVARAERRAGWDPNP